jgi:hypothetical protein
MKINSEKLLLIITLAVSIIAFSSCNLSKGQSNSSLIGKWKCLSDYSFNNKGQLDKAQLIPCLYDLKFNENGLTLLDDRGDNGAWNYRIENNTIFINDDSFGEAFKIKKNTGDTLILIRTSEFSNYKKPLSQMTFLRIK